MSEIDLYSPNTTTNHQDLLDVTVSQQRQAEIAKAQAEAASDAARLELSNALAKYILENGLMDRPKGGSRKYQQAALNESESQHPDSWIQGY